MCEKALPGNVLQLDLFVSYTHQCTSQNATACKIQLQDLFDQMRTISISIEFDSNRFRRISIKICDLSEMIGQ